METISIYEAIARGLGDVAAKGTPTSGTATGFDSNALIHAESNQLKGHEVFFYTGEGAGQARTIIEFLPAHNRSIVEPVFSVVPSADSRFLIFQHWVTDDYEHAMNRAMGWAKFRHLDEKVATIELVATQYEYTVPSGFEFIHTLRLVPSGSTDYGADDEVSHQFEFPPRFWRIEGNPLGSFVISFDPRKVDLDSFNEEWIRIHGQAKPDFTATTIPEEVEEYIIAGASMLLASQRITQNDQSWTNKFRMFRDLTRELEEYIFVSPRGKKVG